MEYLHQKSIVHFDLKSANLLLGYRDRRAVCKVSDFGLSKQKHDTYVSNVTSQRGTLPWIAPEIIKTPHAVTEKVCSRCCALCCIDSPCRHLKRGVFDDAFVVILRGKCCAATFTPRRYALFVINIRWNSLTEWVEHSFMLFMSRL